MKKLSLISIGMLLTSAVWAQGTETVSFPDLNKTYLKTGDFVNLADLKKVALTQYKDQVRLLIGNPHFLEGIGYSRIWNYAFNFYTGKDGGAYITCQYQVQYDKDYRVKGMYWRDLSCAKFLEPAEKPVLVAGRPVNLSSDGLFAFGKSGFNDLQPTGQTHLRDLVSQFKGFSKVTGVRVVGYTDRIGSDQSNLALSHARAETVKRFFVREGIPAGLIQTVGAGETGSVVSCPGSATSRVIACLAPNRRIEVSVTGDQ